MDTTNKNIQHPGVVSGIPRWVGIHAGRALQAGPWSCVHPGASCTRDLIIVMTTGDEEGARKRQHHSDIPRLSGDSTPRLQQLAAPHFLNTKKEREKKRVKLEANNLGQFTDFRSDISLSMGNS